MICTYRSEMMHREMEWVQEHYASAISHENGLSLDDTFKKVLKEICAQYLQILSLENGIIYKSLEVLISFYHPVSWVTECMLTTIPPTREVWEIINCIIKDNAPWEISTRTHASAISHKNGLPFDDTFKDAVIFAWLYVQNSWVISKQNEAENISCKQDTNSIQYKNMASFLHVNVAIQIFFCVFSNFTMSTATIEHPYTIQQIIMVQMRWQNWTMWRWSLQKQERYWAINYHYVIVPTLFNKSSWLRWDERTGQSEGDPYRSKIDTGQ